MSVLHAIGISKQAVVEQEGDKWVLWTRDKKRRLGVHDTAQEAYKQEYAIQKSQESRKKNAGAAPPLPRLLAAKSFSDQRAYGKKHQILVSLVAERPDEFEVDSVEGGIAGLTHMPTGFQIHIPLRQLYRAMPQPLSTPQKLAAVMMKCAIRDFSNGNMPLIQRLGADGKPVMVQNPQTGKMEYDYVENPNYDDTKGQSFMERQGGLKGMWNTAAETGTSIFNHLTNPVQIFADLGNAGMGALNAGRDLWANRDYYKQKYWEGKDVDPGDKLVRSQPQERTDWGYQDVKNQAMAPDATEFDKGLYSDGDRGMQVGSQIGMAGTNIFSGGANLVNSFRDGAYQTQRQADLANRGVQKNRMFVPKKMAPIVGNAPNSNPVPSAPPRPMPASGTAPMNAATTQGGSPQRKTANWLEAVLKTTQGVTPKFEMPKTDFSIDDSASPYQSGLSRLLLDDGRDYGHTRGIMHSVADAAFFRPYLATVAADNLVLPAAYAGLDKLRGSTKPVSQLFTDYRPHMRNVGGTKLDPGSRLDMAWQRLVGDDNRSVLGNVKSVAHSLLQPYGEMLVNLGDRFDTWRNHTPKV